MGSVWVVVVVVVDGGRVLMQGLLFYCFTSVHYLSSLYVKGNSICQKLGCFYLNCGCIWFILIIVLMVTKFELGRWLILIVVLMFLKYSG